MSADFHFAPRGGAGAHCDGEPALGAPFVAVHLSVADGGASGEGGAGEVDLWLSRYAAFQAACGVAPEHAARARHKIAADSSGGWAQRCTDRLLHGVCVRRARVELASGIFVQ